MSEIRPGLEYLTDTERFYSTAKGKEMYDTLKKGNEKFHPFETNAQIFMLGLSLGILTQDKIESDKFDELLFMMPTYTTHDQFGVYPLVIKSMYPDLDDSGIARMMERYAEAGLRSLFREFKNTQKIDFQALIDLMKKK